MLAEIAHAVRSGQIKASELVEESLRRIERLGPQLNAVVALRAEEAMAEASRRVPEGPLAGIPVLVKDLEDVAGMRTTHGSRLFADAAPAQSSDVINARLVAAGAIVVGKTNTPEFALMGYTSNPLFGATRNPWNRKRSPGGSSGGSSAALMAALAPIATASDGGGSVRIPASLTGLVGLKPTFGGFPRQRIPSWMTFSMNGVLGRSVADVVLEASVLVGAFPGDRNALARGVPLTPVRPGRVIATPSFKAHVEAPIRAAFERSCRVLAEDVGLSVEHVEQVFRTEPTPGLGWMLIAGAELAQALERYAGREAEMEPAVVATAALGRQVSSSDYIHAQRTRYEASRQLDLLLGDDAVLVVPTANALAWPAEGPMPTRIEGHDCLPVDGANTMELNFTGHPAVSVPMGLDPNGVPMGLQIVAPRHRDDLALGLALELERAQPWPTVATGYEPFPGASPREATADA